jgi:hypothetical protein
LQAAKLHPLLSKNNEWGKFADIAYKSTQYRDLEHLGAWKDFMHTIAQVRLGMQNNLIRSGGMDKEGRDHSDELRAVIHTLDVILGHVPAIHAEFERQEKLLEQQQNKLPTPPAMWRA